MTKLATFDHTFIQLNEVNSKWSSKSGFSAWWLMSTCLVVVEEQLEVVLLVDRRVAVRVIVYHKPIANVLWTLSRLVKIICTLQINWVSTTAQQGTLFGSGCKTAESKLYGKVAHTMLSSLVSLDEAIREIALATPFTTLTSIKQQPVAAISKSFFLERVF